ncbi:hypothetical protein BJX61DRAFT_444789 [Aspergillus egyptiacus]|nr:hypothetical protein BJX61DRAFT_444789 [Aspergillus egyptiacus]
MPLLHPYASKTRSNSFASSSSFSTSTSTSGSIRARESFGAPSAHTRRLQRTSSTHKLKRWLSSHLTTRQPHPYPGPIQENQADVNEDTATTADSQAHADAHAHKLSLNPTETTISEYSSEMTTQLCQTSVQSYSDYTYSQHSNHHHPSNRELERLERERQDPLSDSYAAYCRAFTSSPPPAPAGPIHLQSESGSNPEFARSPHNPTPLPWLPQSSFYEEYPPPRENPSSASEKEIGFLPIGAHGYHPASWGLPRPPTPPPGILTPERYAQMQQQCMGEREERDKKTGKLTRCLAIRVPWLPWGRAKAPS